MIVTGRRVARRRPFPTIAAVFAVGGPDQAVLKYAFDHLSTFCKHGLGYAQEMANRPQTLYSPACCVDAEQFEQFLRERKEKRGA